MTAVAASSVAMTAIVLSPVAMAALWESTTAIQVLQNNATAWATFTGASSTVMGKTVAILAGLDPDAYADMAAVAASSVAMTAVAASSVAMTAVAASSVAMAAVAASSTAAAAIEASSTAISALGSSPLKVTDAGGYGNTSSKRTVRAGRAFIISVTFGQSNNTSYYGNLTTFLLGSSPYRATCTAASRAVNRFATEVICYGEYSGLSDNINYSQVVYIPC